MDGCWHCIHPEYLEHQLDLSLHRLRAQTLDIYLLHNPEYFLSHAQKKGLSKEQAREEFYRRLQDAFVHLETEVQRGRIQWYGVSSNTLGADPDEFEMTSLSRFCEIAESLSSNHHFAAIQFPANLLERDGLGRPNNGPDTVVSLAKKKNLGVLINRPLNAFGRQELVRLADFSEKPDVPPLEISLRSVQELENLFRETLAPALQSQSESRSPASIFRWGSELAQADLAGLAPDRWSEIRSYRLVPQLAYQLSHIDQCFMQLAEKQSWYEWRANYTHAMELLLDGIANACAREAQPTRLEISQQLDRWLPKEWHSQGLSRKALGFLMHTDGIHCVLNGMRHPDYVQDALSTAALPAFTLTQGFWTELDETKLGLTL